MKKLTFVFALVMATSCRDAVAPPQQPLDPCTLKGACEVAGVDLVVDSFDVVFPQDAPTDPGNHLPYVQNFDSVTVRYRIRNRGDAAVAASSAWVVSCESCPGGHGRGLPLDSLWPGDVQSGSFRVPATTAQEQSASSRPSIFLPAVDEPFYGNNLAVAPHAYETVAPIMGGSFQILSPEVPIDTCNRQFGRYQLSSLPPGYAQEDTIDVQLTQQNYYYERHTAIPVMFDACIGGSTPYVTFKCAVGARVTLLPDVESACSIQDIPLDSTIAGSFAHSCYIYLDDYDVWRVNAHAGLTYTATASTPARMGFWDHDGKLQAPEDTTAASFTAAQTGLYYLVVHRGYSRTDTDFTIRLQSN